MTFDLQYTDPKSNARAGIITTDHGQIEFHILLIFLALLHDVGKVFSDITLSRNILKNEMWQLLLISAIAIL